MDLSLEAAEKYFWTWLDFVRLRPKRFSDERQNHPDQYLPPGQFFVGSLIICSAVQVVAAGTLQGVGDKKLQAYFDAYFGADPKLFVARHVLYVVAIVILGAASQRLVLWWPLRSPATVVNLLTAKFYLSALFVAIATLDSLLACILVLILPIVPSNILPYFLLLWGVSEYFVLTIILLVYDLLSVGAFARLKVRRLFEGSLILGLAGSAIGAPVGALIGSYFDHQSGTPYDWGFVVIFVISLLPAALFIWVVLKRVPKLQARVRAEYGAIPGIVQLPNVDDVTNNPSPKPA